MQSKFSKIVQVRKEQLDKVEAQLIKARHKESELKAALNGVLELINTHHFPTSGSSALIVQASEELRILRAQKSGLEEQLRLISAEISHHQNRYKMANIELEKVKYLHSNELTEHLKRIKKAHATQLDEIAVMRHSFLKDMQNG